MLCTSLASCILSNKRMFKTMTYSNVINFIEGKKK